MMAPLRPAEVYDSSAEQEFIKHTEVDQRRGMSLMMASVRENFSVTATTKTPGADVSKWQNLAIPDRKVNFKGMYDEGLRFVWIKATEGTAITDAYFVQNWYDALEAGLIVGAYHFFRSNLDGVAQARKFLDVALPLYQEAGMQGLPPKLDIETADSTSNGIRIARAYAWLVHVRTQLKKPGFYSSPGLWGYLMSPTPWWTTDFWGWDAHWTSAAMPILPNGWTWPMTRAWQIGVSRKHAWVPIVHSHPSTLDYNYFFGSEEDLKQFADITENPEPPTPEPPAELVQVKSWANLNVRTGPSTAHTIVRTLRPGDIVPVYDAHRNWLRLTPIDSSPEWVHSAYVESLHWS
jgi:lysozyme